MPSSACRRGPPGSTSSGWRRPPPTTGACRPCSRTSRASSTTSRSPASPARRRPWPSGWRRRWRGSSGTPGCRWRWASASASPSRPPRSRASPTPRWWARPSSTCSPSTSTRRAGPRLSWFPPCTPRCAPWPRRCGMPRRMSWLTDYVRPKIRALYTRDKPEMPENLWQQCASCERMIFHRDLEANQRVCPHCDHHMRVGPDYRFAALFDEGSWQRLEMPQEPARPVALPRPEEICRPPARGPGQDQGRRRARGGARPGRRAAGRDRGHELRVHGRLDGHQPRRGLRRRRPPRGRATTRPSSWSPPRAARACRRARCP